MFHIKLQSLTEPRRYEYLTLQKFGKLQRTLLDKTNEKERMKIVSITRVDCGPNGITKEEIQ